MASSQENMDCVLTQEQEDELHDLTVVFANIAMTNQSAVDLAMKNVSELPSPSEIALDVEDSAERYRLVVDAAKNMMEAKVAYHEACINLHSKMVVKCEAILSETDKAYIRDNVSKTLQDQLSRKNTAVKSYEFVTASTAAIIHDYSQYMKK
jgi:hypothetical protein